MGLITKFFSGGKGPPQPPANALGEFWKKDPWNLDRPVLPLSQDDFFTLRKAMEAILIFGEIGAAKTTGSGAAFLLQYLRLRLGVLFNCIKAGDADYLLWLMRRAGVAESLILVEPSKDPAQPPRWRCNLLRYALAMAASTGSRVESIVSLLMTIVEMAERGEKGGVSDKFWSRSCRQLLRNVVQICLAARGTVSMKMIHEAILSAPRTPAAVRDSGWQAGSLLNQLINEAEGKKGERSAREQSDYELAAKYICTEFAGMPPDTQGSVLATYSVLADVLLRGDMADLFDSDTNFIPEVTFEGAVICLNLPIKTYGQAAVYVQAAFTYLWQLAVERRDIKNNPGARPVAWFCDEAQELICAHTPRFLQTARSALCASILISQNISNYFAALGQSGRDEVEATLANAGTKLYHANGHFLTNKLASDTISEELQARGSWHGTVMKPDGGRGGSSEQIGAKVLPAAFTMLKKGGPQNGFVTEAIIYQTGASFEGNDGEPYMHVTFAQLIPGVEPRSGT